MKKLPYLALLALILTQTGCSIATSTGNQTIAPIEPFTYNVTVEKSAQNISHFPVSQAQNPTSIQAIMNHPPIVWTETKIGEQETITKLDGVIATASKGWNLYINDKKIPFINLTEIMVQPSDTITWKYELIDAIKK